MRVRIGDNEMRWDEMGWDGMRWSEVNGMRLHWMVCDALNEIQNYLNETEEIQTEVWLNEGEII